MGPIKMTKTRLSLLASLGLAGTLLLSACSSKPPPAPPRGAIPIYVTTTREVNADAQGRAAPVVVRVYGLANKDSFNLAAPIQLIQQDAKTLGADQLDRQELVLAPSDQKLITQPANDKVNYVGVVAAYRAIDKVKWREVVAVPATGNVILDVTVGATGVTVQQRPLPEQKK